ncbi:uncharacterized protein LOC111386605 isoform X1 [Olea europaea var. sylvestris]|uniref:uncharacterized protein LOC111386605 isoform X1 n=1 Tax=Olea europaea var. sylvestris TaxID=158386 RepID=UPI000C1CE9AD|nr:uncharacterized protein LOC111386605 isoform X1 [Olea europaea var. sylvestris]
MRLTFLKESLNLDQMLAMKSVQNLSGLVKHRSTISFMISSCAGSLSLWSKYELQEFLKPSLRITSASKKGSLQARLSQKIMNNFRSSSSSSQQSVSPLPLFVPLSHITSLPEILCFGSPCFKSPPYRKIYLIADSLPMTKFSAFTQLLISILHNPVVPIFFVFLKFTSQ